MTKNEIIFKYAGMLAAERNFYEKNGGIPPLEIPFYKDFEKDCKTNGYIGACKDDLWAKACDKSDRMDFNNFPNLKQVRLCKGLSQNDLATLSGVSLRTLQEHEQGRRPLKSASYEVVIKIAAALGIEPEEIV